jgi:ABC-type nitrate/sulfonate/bicarbonate transport system permease component
MSSRHRDDRAPAEAVIVGPRRGRSFSGFLLILVLLAAWEGSALLELVSPFYLPAPHRVARSLVSVAFDGRLLPATVASLARGLAGYATAIVLGVTIGLLAGHHPRVRDLIDPLVELLRPLPSPAIIPPAILFLGIGASMKVFIIAWACFFPILVNTIDGVRSVPPALVETGRNLGLGYLSTLLSVVLPAASPAIFTGLRIALAIMLILTVISEMVAGNSGLGFLLLEAERTFRVADMYALIVVLAVIGYGLNWLFVGLDRRVLAWHHAMHRPPRP